ncbi:MAG TPA: aminopeptidase P N-terminal domain-containing protein, partial [Longimicrobiales bacterium]|nr:aminopeptidase P N-terminal domain-containing protein [Longimicrobiales bacterium]
MAGFPPRLFRGRRRRALEALEGGVMVLPAAPTRFRSRDTEYAYRPDSELFYLTGFTEPGAVAVLRGFADEERYVLFVRERDEESERWAGPRVGPERASELYGADRTRPLAELEDALPELLEGARAIHYRLGADPRTQGLVEEALATARRKGPRRGTGPRAVVDPGEILDEMRVVKDDEELGRIRRACRNTVEAFRAAARAVAPGAGEWEVEAELERAVRRAGASGPGFPTIVGGGANACVLHYDANGAALVGGEAVLVDAGAEVDLYHADVTRTFPVAGEWSPEQRDLYGVVESAREAGLEAVGPGTTTAEVHDAALGELVDGMLALGL